MKYLTLLLVVLSFQSLASPLPDFPFITVTGKAKAEVQPDIATLSFQLIAFAPKAEAAKRQLDQSALALVKVLNQYSVSPSQITSFEIDKRAKRKRDSSYNDLSIVGYELNQSFEIKLQSLEHYPELSQKLLQMEQLTGLRTSFDVTDRLQIEAQLVQQAGVQARQDAQQLAQGMGVQLGKVYAINSTGSYQEFFATFGLANQQEHMAARSNEMYMTPNQSKSQLFIPQTISISKQLNVVYELNN